MEYKHNATALIAEAFMEQEIAFSVFRHDNDQEDLVIGVHINNGPSMSVKFISCDDDNDVSMCIFGLINNVTPEKKARVLEACNMLNASHRFVRFIMDKDMDVNLEYDFPLCTPDHALGRMCVEIFHRTALLLDDAYAFLMMALYTDQELVFDNKIAHRRMLVMMLHRLLHENGQTTTGHESPEELISLFRELHMNSDDEPDDCDACDVFFDSDELCDLDD